MFPAPKGDADRRRAGCQEPRDTSSTSSPRRASPQSCSLGSKHCRPGYEPWAPFPTSRSHAAGQARSSRRAAIHYSSPRARPAPASITTHIWRADIKVVRLLFHTVGSALDVGAAATRPTSCKSHIPAKQQQTHGGCRANRILPPQGRPHEEEARCRGSCQSRERLSPRAPHRCRSRTRSARRGAPTAPLRTAARGPRPPGRDGTGRGGGRRAALSRYDRPDRRDRALAHSQWHHPRWQHQCRRKQRPWLCVAQSESPSHGWKSGLPAQLRASA